VGRGAGGGHGELGDPRVVAEHVRAEVLAATRLHCSVGVGDNKLRAKIATDFGKPGGVGQLTAEDWFEVMGDRPTTALWGIGRKTGSKLAALGIDTVDQLARSDARVLAAELGPTMGPWYHRLGRGVDSSPVDATPWVPRAHGREETYQEDLEDRDRVVAEVCSLTRRVLADIDREGRLAARVGLKVRLRPFLTVSRSLTLPEPSRDAEVLAAAAVSLLDRVELDRPVRLLGVRLEMTEPPGGY
jgi:DNA polymerase-4